MRRIAYFSPLPPERSGISDYSAELLPHLAQRVSVGLFCDRPQTVSSTLTRQASVFPLEDFPDLRWEYDIALYQLGNSRYHKGIYSMMMRHPGITVLHETGLHHLALDRSLPDAPSGAFDGDSLFVYAREMGYEKGLDGIALAYSVLRGRAAPPLFEVPLHTRALDHSLGLIVHSRFAAELVQTVRPGLAVRVAPAPIRSDWEDLLTRGALGCPEDALIFASAGMVTRHKQIPLTLEAFAQLAEEFSEIMFVIVGEEPDARTELARWLAGYHLQDRVLCTGYVPDLHHFVSWISAADVLLNLRHPTLGETSATALRGLAAGRPVIVSNTGWYAELPDDVCVKVEADDLGALVTEMRRLIVDSAARREIGARARDYAKNKHDPALTAQCYVEFIEEVLSAGMDRLQRLALPAGPTEGMLA